MKRIATFIVLLLMTLCVEAQTFTQSRIPDDVWKRMQGRSVPKGCTVKRAELRYLRLSYWDADGVEQVGEMVCNRLIANDLIDIFKQLYDKKYIIGRMALIDDFGASDERSMTNNNTSCFCYRPIAGTKKLSKHSRGMAVDINPLYNPCVKRGKVSPAAGEKYAFRRNTRTDIPMKIDISDLCYRLFISHGFKWGGAWKTTKDYQHFEK